MAPVIRLSFKSGESKAFVIASLARLLPDDEAALVKKFKLESTKHVKLVAFNSQNKIHTYNNVDEIITEWTACRLEVYRQRRLAIIQLCNDKFSKAENKYKFIAILMAVATADKEQTRSVFK